MINPEETSKEAIDPQARKAFSQKTFADLVGFMNVGMCVIGDRLGLFKDLDVNGPATSSELAARAGIFERYSREWLRQMACAEYLDYDPATQRFSLPPAHAQILAREGQHGFLGGLYQNVQSIEDGFFSKILSAFRQGGGIPYSDYNADFWDGLDRYAMGGLKHSLLQKYIPGMPDVQAALEQGALVADVGCGRGGIILILAGAFPKSHFVGYDAFAPNIDLAQSNAEAAGLADRAKFVRRNVMEGLPEKYDLIFCFDTLHHATDVPRFMRAMHAALNPSGAFVCSEEACSENFTDDIGLGGAVMYASSIFVCVPQVLSESDVAYGAAGINPSVMRELSVDVGFQAPRLVPLENSGINLYEVKR